MKGLEMMLANLLGMKPDEMRAQFEGALNLMKNGASAAEKMQQDIDAIKRHLGINAEEQINGRTAISDNRARDGNRIEL